MASSAPNSRPGAVSRPIVRILTTALIALAPLAATLALARLHLRTNITQFVPYFNDEVGYWHQVLTFKTAGFNGGYYSLNEWPPMASFLHYDTFGPWYPMLYGAAAVLVGWEPYSGIIVNGLALAVALFTFYLLLRLPPRRALLAGGFTLTSWPVLLFLFSNMQESLQQAFAIGTAILFYAVITRRGRLPAALYRGGLAWLLAIAITRPAWALLFLPYFGLASRRRGWGRLIMTLLQSTLAVGVVLLAGMITGAPGNNSIYKTIGSFTISPDIGVRYLLAYVSGNLAAFFNPRKPLLDWLQTVQTLVLIAGALIVLWRRRGAADGIRDEAAFHALNLGGIVAASQALYIVGTGGDYRVTGAHLLLSGLLLVLCRRDRVALALLASNLVFFPAFLDHYAAAARPALTADRAALTEFRAAAHQAVRYDPHAASAWCNTLILPIPLYDERLTGIPGGIGLSFFVDADEVPLPLKSQYLLTDPVTAERLLRRQPRPRLELLAEQPAAALYRNLDANCAPGG